MYDNSIGWRKFLIFAKNKREKTMKQELDNQINNTMMCKKKPIVFIDMDNVIVDFQSGVDRLENQVKQEFEGHIEDTPGLFALMDPISGAIEAIQKLRDCYELYILSTAPWDNPTAWCDKLNWVKKYFGNNETDVFYKRLIFSHHKNLCHGDYLIDDRPHKHGVDQFSGEVIHFGSEQFPGWNEVVKYLMEKNRE